ncbi:DUF4091 domain-containing protein [Paenibacillus sacheonensis]|uniref:DUF4091 domain-containing protein n=1 Tax=Paenibacillus sacheonensis TaxID=742054 RepID=A0A7X4YVY7_9BACL|nr:DUF4091 domain-containing protein [Paenibacillus sacheonensis]MBM7568905.1 hypothetical protein [Paenibacillus sacheonensis]NBC72606.1 DUF4091 domain-containing protein [Paenibacillus sacheonensis]
MGNDHVKLELRCISSLAKVFADEELTERAYRQASALANETASFQVAYRSNRLLKGMRVSAESDIDAEITLRSVGLVPSEMPVYADHDEHVLRTSPGLYPDPLLEPSAAEGWTALPGQWRSVWVTVEPGEAPAPGRFGIRIRFETANGEHLGEERFELDLLPMSLPEQQLIHTEWFHTDCLATYYRVDVFSEAHWSLIESYARTAAKHGINMLLTPLFTPPLDTQVGGERPTVQLVDVHRIGDGAYRFGFDRLSRWVELCRRQGIAYFEFSHLFTQWGAQHAPKIMAVVEDGTTKRIFGWETDAGGEEYRAFIGQFLPELTGWIKANGLERCSYFHISDEPSIDHLDSYASASGMVEELLQGFPVIDALSDYAFYEKGLVKNPIPASDHIEPFLAHGVEPLWTYYCCGQYKQVANRFFSMPSARNRILGIQLYKFNLTGFLQWGYNFWYSQHSRSEIDPYRVTDAVHAFPSGDAFLVYPGDGKPVESIRLEVLREALQDLRALRLLEERYGRDFVLSGLEEGLDRPISFSCYPRDAEWLLAKREWVNAKLQEQGQG